MDYVNNFVNVFVDVGNKLRSTSAWIMSYHPLDYVYDPLDYVVRPPGLCRTNPCIMTYDPLYYFKMPSSI